MKKLKNDLFQSICDATRDIELPRTKNLIFPKISESTVTEKFAKFGALLLEDDSCGFVYTMLDEQMTHSKLLERLAEEVADSPALDIAEWYLSNDIAKRHIGMAAINAISQHVFEQKSFFSKQATSKKTANKAKHLGMIGFFPPLVKKFRESGQKLTVIEKNPDFVVKERNFEVTLDSKQLIQCDEILCTASTLLNDSLEDIINACSPDASISLIGPTAGCLPDALFDARISEVGASRVIDIDRLVHRIRNSEPWGDSVRKYVIRTEDYPGYTDLY